MDHIETLEAMKHGMVPDIEALAALDAAIAALRDHDQEGKDG